MKYIGTLLFLVLTGCILTHSQLGMSYAAMGLTLWFQKMIPALLPFMILSGLVVRLKLTEGAVALVYPVIRPLYRVSKNVCYCMLMGFLCGFPMGARVVSELYSRDMITHREAEYLLAFCNNIGPVYFCSFVLPLLHREMIGPYLFGMYGIPALYGLILRYTLFRDLGAVPNPVRKHKPGELCICSGEKPETENSRTKLYITGSLRAGLLFSKLDESIFSAVQGILTLGGYMVFCNLLNLLPHVLFQRQIPLLAPLLEITGGLSLLQDKAPLYSLLALSFGGLSCIAQTNSCIRGTQLSILDYTLHKAVLTLFNGLFYLGWFLFANTSFLC